MKPALLTLIVPGSWFLLALTGRMDWVIRMSVPVVSWALPVKTGGGAELTDRVLSAVDRVVFVTVMVPREWEGPNNGVIESAAAYPNAVVVDWHAIGVGNPNFFWEDEFHLQPHGADFYAGPLALQSELPE